MGVTWDLSGCVSLWESVFSVHRPPHSGHTRCSGSSVVVCRNGTWSTTSSALGRPSRPHSCRVERGTRRPCPHPRLLQNRAINPWINHIHNFYYIHSTPSTSIAFNHSPIGSTPASMNVAMVKLASTKRKRMPQHGGTAGQMVTASHGHLNMQTQDKEGKRGNSVYHHSSPGVQDSRCTPRIWQEPGKYPSLAGRG